MSSYTRNQWATALLAAIGNTSPSNYTLDWTICWTQFETAWPDSSAYNLLNTTQPLNGSTGGGTQGNIQNYNSFTDGITANAMTLKNGNYPALLQALQFNDEASLQAASGGISSNLGTWGTGHGSSIAVCAMQASLSNNNSEGSQSFSGPGTGSVGSGTPLTGTSPTGVTDLFPSLTGLFQTLQPLFNWLSDPVRLFKLIAGIGLIMLGLIMLVAPDTIKTIAKHPEMLLA